MDKGLGDPLSIAKDATLIKDSQSEVSKLDLLVCGICYGVFHFVEEFSTHKASECDVAEIAKPHENDDKSQTWAFCLWKNEEIKSHPLDKGESMWSIYQRWCTLPEEVRNTWVAGGQTLLSLNRVRIAKMQEVKFKVKREEEKDPLTLTDNDALLSDLKDEKNDAKTETTRFTKNDLSNSKKDSDKKDKEELNEYVVESILGKRFNAKKKHWEYKVKWENWDESQCSWEPMEHLTGCKALISKFEEKLRMEKEKKKTPAPLKITPNTELKTDDESTDPGSIKRPQRNSKKKALSQVKRWLGESSDNEDYSKRTLEDDDSDQSFEKRLKLEEDSDESFMDEDDDKPKRITSIKSRNLSNGLEGKKIPHNVLIPDAQGVVRINQKQLPSLSSGVYIMSKTAGIIKLDPQTSKIAASGGQAVVKVAPRIGQTHIRIVKKDGGTTNRVIQMSPKPKSVTPLSTPKITQKVTKMVKQYTPSSKSNLSSLKTDEQKKNVAKTIDENKETNTADEESDDGLPELEFPSEIVPPEPEEPQDEFTLDPTTGKIAGIEYPEHEPEVSEDKENPESTIDNIVKLAAADITEADLKPDLNESMETSIGQENNVDKHQTVSAMDEKKPELIHKEDVTKVKKDPTKQAHQKFVITPNVKSSNILERTLQTPKTLVKSPQGYVRQVYTAKSPQRILNSTMTPKLTSPMSPMVRTVVRSAYSSKPKQIMQKQRVYMSPPASKFNDGSIKHSYTKSNMNKRIGNIGNTTIYKKTSQHSRFSSTPKVVARTNIRKSMTPVVRTVVQKSPKQVISMPSLMDDDMPTQNITESIPVFQKADSYADVSETSTNATVATSDTDLSSFTLNDGEAPIFITGDDGTVYQVAGQNEQGQTILITQGPDGQQQCLLVTSENASSDDTQEEGATNQVDAAVENTSVSATVEQMDTTEETTGVNDEETHHRDPQEPLTLKTDSDQVVAQVVRAEPPSPGGTHKVVVMLPDGNLMVTQVTPEEYASLELDK